MPLQWSCWFFCLLLLRVFAQNQPGSSLEASGEGDGEGFSIAAVSINGQDPVSLRVPHSGELAYQDLSGEPSGFSSPSSQWGIEEDEEDEEDEEIGFASVASSDGRHVTCFFWSVLPSSVNGADRDFISQAFSTDGGLRGTAPPAQRLLCYDSTADKASGDVFAIVTVNSRHEPGLLRVRIDEGKPEAGEAIAAGGERRPMSGQLLINYDTDPHWHATNVTTLVLLDTPTTSLMQTADDRRIEVPLGDDRRIEAPLVFCLAVSSSRTFHKFYSQELVHMYMGPVTFTRFVCYVTFSKEDSDENW